jgi:hypothetical protein
MGYPLPPCPPRSRAGLRGVSRSGLRRSEEHRGLSWASAPLQGFQPVGPAGPKAGSSHGVYRPYDGRTNTDPDHPGLPHPAPSGLRVSTLPPACSPRPLPIRRSAPSLGFTLQGFAPPGRPCSFPSPCPLAVPRLSLPSPLRTRRSGGPSRLQGFPPAGEPCPSGGSWLPSGPLPSWVAVPSGALAPPRWSRLPGPSPLALSRPGNRRLPGRRRSRVSLGGEVRRTLASPPAPLGSVASARPGSASEEARRRAAVGARSEVAYTRFGGPLPGPSGGRLGDSPSDGTLNWFSRPFSSTLKDIRVQVY